MYKSIFTSGLTGFIGNNLLIFLLKDFEYVVNFERNNQVTIHSKSGKENTSLSKELINKFDAGQFLHLATLYRPNAKNADELFELIKSNIEFIIKIIERYLSKEDTEIINVSSYMQLLEIKYQNSYSLSKEIVNKFLVDSGYKHKNIYLFDSFGTGDTREKVTDIFIKNILNNQKIKIPHNDVSINLTHVDDICFSIINSLKYPQGDYSINSRHSITLEDLAMLIMKILNLNVTIEKSGAAINYLENIKRLPKNIYLQHKNKSLEVRLKERINEIQKTKNT